MADFIIQEVVPDGAAEPHGGLALFTWNAKHHNIPVRPWSFGITQRTNRTDYPGADDPTEQVLGPKFEEFSLRGRWDDRYNPQGSIDVNTPAGFGILRSGNGRAAARELGGYAVKTMRAFELMVRRGNLVRLTFEDVTVQGIITSCNFDYRRSWDIGYEFTLSPHHRQPKGQFALKRSPRSVLNSRQLRDEVSEVVDELLELHERAPQTRLVGTIWLEVEAILTALQEGVAAIDSAIDQRNLTLETEADGGLLRLASAFFSVATASASLIEVLRSLDSSEALDFEAAIEVLDYDAWARGIMQQARLLVINAQRASVEVRKRSEPNAQRLYRPIAGESLYSVSNRFYNSPHNWRKIARRNGLVSFVLTGDELLIIPEITGR